VLFLLLLLQALVAAANGVVSSIAERIGPIHINPAEQGLLETIWLLLTSIICVPAVCKFIPGGSPVLGYLVSGGCVMGCVPVAVCQQQILCCQSSL
jgi:hypothetical protein